MDFPVILTQNCHGKRIAIRGPEFTDYDNSINLSNYFLLERSDVNETV